MRRAASASTSRATSRSRSRPAAFSPRSAAAFYAQKELYIDPGSTLATSLSIKMALVAILGGVGSLGGPVLGAVILTAIEEAHARRCSAAPAAAPTSIIYALLIIVVAVFYPGGVAGWWRDCERRLHASAQPRRAPSVAMEAKHDGATAQRAAA